MTAVAFIENACNSLSIDYSEFNKTANIYSYKEKSRDFTWLPLNFKIIVLVSYVTNGVLTINSTHNTIQAIRKLIKIRNRIVHRKDLYRTTAAKDINKNDGSKFEISTGDETLDTLNDAHIERFYKAAVDYVQTTFKTYEAERTLKEVGFIIKET